MTLLMQMSDLTAWISLAVAVLSLSINLINGVKAWRKDGRDRKRDLNSCLIKLNALSAESERLMSEMYDAVKFLNAYLLDAGNAERIKETHSRRLWAYRSLWDARENERDFQLTQGMKAATVLFPYLFSPGEGDQTSGDASFPAWRMEQGRYSLWPVVLLKDALVAKWREIMLASAEIKDILRGSNNREALQLQADLSQKAFNMFSLCFPVLFAHWLYNIHLGYMPASHVDRRAPFRPPRDMYDIVTSDFGRKEKWEVLCKIADFADMGSGHVEVPLKLIACERVRWYFLIGWDPI